MQARYQAKSIIFQRSTAPELLKEANCARNREINARPAGSGNSVILCDISQNAHSSKAQRVFPENRKERFMPKKVVSIADGVAKAGESIPVTGIYSVRHREHHLPAEVTLVAGHTFPRCEACSCDVFFRLRHRLLDRSAMFQFHFEIYQLPVLDERNKRAG